MLLGFRSAAHAEAAELFAGRGGAGHRRRRRRPAPGWSPTCCASGSTPIRRPPCSPAARRRCSRRCGRCAPSAACPPSWRWSPAWPAASAPASAAWCPRGTGYLRLCVDGPVLDADRLDSRRSCPGPGTERRGPLRRGARGPVLNGSGHLRRDRRPPGLRRRAARALPVPRLRLQDDHPRAAPGQPAAAAVGDPGGHDQLDRAAEQGPGGLPASTTCRGWPSCRCRSWCR